MVYCMDLSPLRDIHIAHQDAGPVVFSNVRNVPESLIHLPV